MPKIPMPRKRKQISEGAAHAPSQPAAHAPAPAPAARATPSYNTPDIQFLRHRLGLVPHPVENGLFTESFRSSHTVLASSSSPAPTKAKRGRRPKQSIGAAPQDGKAAAPPAAVTAIYYLLAAGDHSPWHRMRSSSEVWCHHVGGVVVIHVLEEEGGTGGSDGGTGGSVGGTGGSYAAKYLGNPLDCRMMPEKVMPQHVVPAGAWFAMELMAGDLGGVAAGGLKPWALMSEAMGPGFVASDMEMADRAALLARFPDQAAVIEKFF